MQRHHAMHGNHKATSQPVTRTRRVFNRLGWHQDFAILWLRSRLELYDPGFELLAIWPHMKISDEMKGLAAECAEQIGADGLTVWLAEDGGLIALFNPLEPEIEGLRQTISRGLISQVFLTGQPIIERDPATNPAHDATIDNRTGRHCRSVMAAPWNGSEGAEGVVSAVLFAIDGSGGEFTLVELGKLADLARRMEEGCEG